MTPSQIRKAELLVRRWDPILKLAKQGDIDAQFKLGLRYELGHGVPQDNQEAAKWYQFAAEKGLAEAQFNLATMYREGHGIGKNYLEAYKWFHLASVYGLKEAQTNRKLLEKQMTPSQIRKAELLIKAWKPKERGWF